MLNINSYYLYSLILLLFCIINIYAREHTPCELYSSKKNCIEFIDVCNACMWCFKHNNVKKGYCYELPSRSSEFSVNSQDISNDSDLTFTIDFEDKKYKHQTCLTTAYNSNCINYHIKTEKADTLFLEWFFIGACIFSALVMIGFFILVFRDSDHWLAKLLCCKSNYSSIN